MELFGDGRLPANVRNPNTGGQGAAPAFDAPGDSQTGQSLWNGEREPKPISGKATQDSFLVDVQILNVGPSGRGPSAVGIADLCAFARATGHAVPWLIDRPGYFLLRRSTRSEVRDDIGRLRRATLR